MADCFRFRRKVGQDVALEALKSYLRDYRGGIDELLHFARIRGVAKRVGAYLDALA